MKSRIALFLAAVSLTAGVVDDVRAQKDLARAEAIATEYRKSHGATPELVEAVSWLGRKALAAGQLDSAERFSGETRRLALDTLKARKLDAEPHLPLALGASIEVHAQVLDRQGRRSEAVSFLNEELKRWRGTSIETRTRKNLNLLSLEGKPAPPLEGRNLTSLRGKPVLLFFWAHWCPDCKTEVPVLARLQSEFGPRGLTLVGPTKLYGYAAGGEDASPQQEAAYIEEIRRKYYGMLKMEVPLSTVNFTHYGASTTPTLVLVDSMGIVRLYHPGAMTYEELAANIRKLLR